MLIQTCRDAWDSYLARARTQTMICSVIHHYLQIIVFYFPSFLNSIFYIASTVFRYFDVGVKTMKRLYRFWHRVSCQTAATVAYASCLFKHLEIRGGSWLTQGQSITFHPISSQDGCVSAIFPQSGKDFWCSKTPTIDNNILFVA